MGASSEKKLEPNVKANFLERRFHLQENNTTVRREMLAGLITFLSTAYILAVNPSILSQAGMNPSGVFVATALAAVIGTLIMAFLANYPFVLAPGMGLNAYFTYAIVLGMGYSWQFALFAIFVEGLIFIVLTLTKVRESVFNAVPYSLRIGVGTGIGLYLIYIGTQNAHLIVNDDATLTTLLSFNSQNIHTSGICGILCFLGVVLLTALYHKKINGALFLGIIVTWILGMIFQASGVYQPNIEEGYYSLFPSFDLNAHGAELIGGFKEVCLAAFDVDKWNSTTSEQTGWNLLFSMNIIVVLFALLFVDFFDTLGTVIAVANKGELYDQNGKLPRLREVLLADACATAAGGAIGTSTTTTYLESITGVIVGGRTGLTALTAAGLFLVSIVFAPIFLALPAFATSSVLIFVGFLMTSQIVKLDFQEYTESTPALMTAIMIPFTYSISEGIALGFISWTLINLFSGNWRKINCLMYVLTFVFIAKYIFVK